MSIVPVTGELGGIDEDPPADGVDLLGHPVDGGTTPVTFEAPVTASSATRPAWRASAASRSSSSTVPSRCARDVDDRPATPPRQEVGVVLEDRRQHDLALGDDVIVRAKRLMASVVFFVNITTSRSGSAPTKPPTTSRASSNAAVLSRDL